MTKRSQALKRAQQKYHSTLKQIKFYLSKDEDKSLIEFIGELPSFKSWVVEKIRKEQQMRIKIIKLEGSRRLVKGKYADLLDLDYAQNLDELYKDINLALPSLLESLSLVEKLTMAGDIIVVRGSNHIDIVQDGKGSLGWLTVENHIDF